MMNLNYDDKVAKINIIVDRLMSEVTGGTGAIFSDEIEKLLKDNNVDVSDFDVEIFDLIEKMLRKGVEDGI